MSFMSVLKAIGKGIIKAGQIVERVEPVATMFIPAGPMLNLFTAVSAIVVNTEHIAVGIEAGTGTKVDKFAMALPQVIDLLHSVELAAHKDLVDEELLKKAAAEILQGVVDFYNAIDQKAAG